MGIVTNINNARHTTVGRLVERLIVLFLTAGITAVVNSPELAQYIVVGSAPYIILHTLIDALDPAIPNL